MKAGHRTHLFWVREKLPSPCVNVGTREEAAFTNTGPACAFRAPGYVEGTFALESTLDELANRLNIDPLEIRLKNYADRNQAKDLPYSSKDLKASYARGAERIGWNRKRTSAGRRHPMPL